MSTQILINPEALSPTYLPKKLLHREKEKAELATNLKNFVNTFICGPCGCGKTALVKQAIRDLKGEITVAYIDCSIYQTTYSILKEILPRGQLIVCRSNYELIKELLRYAKERRFAVCFDNFEKLKEKDLIARLMSLNVCVVLISDEEESLSLLKPSVKANIPSILKLQPYTVEQSFDILKRRAEEAFVRSTYSDEVIKKIAEKIKGNITLGINALKLAALKAESENKKAIDDVKIRLNDNHGMKLSLDERLILKILAEYKSLPAGKLYELYFKSTKYPKGERSFRNYMKNLCLKNLVKALGDKRGRVYEIVDLDVKSSG